MLEKVKKFLLTCRLEPDEFDSIQDKIIEINRLMLILVAAATTAIVGSLAILSVFIEDIRQNQPLYLIGVIIAFSLMTLAKSLLKTSVSIPFIIDGYLFLFLWLWHHHWRFSKQRSAFSYIHHYANPAATLFYQSTNSHIHYFHHLHCDFCSALFDL